MEDDEIEFERGLYWRTIESVQYGGAFGLYVYKFNSPEWIEAVNMTDALSEMFKDGVQLCLFHATRYAVGGPNDAN